MRFRAKDLVWVLPLALFAGVGTIFSSAFPEDSWRETRSREDGFDGPWGDGPWGDGQLSEALDTGVLVAAAIVVLAALVQLAARARPGTTLLVTGALVGGYLALGFHDGPVFVVLVVSSFVAACHAPLRTWGRCVGVTLVVVLGGMVVRELGDADGFAVSTLWQASATLGLTLAAGLLGSLLRGRRHAAREQAQHAATAEQLRTAQELHDGVGHGLAVIAMQSGVALHVLDRDPAAARAALEAIRDTSRESLGSLRVELSRMAGQEAPRRPRPGLADLPALVARVEGAGVRVTVRDDVSHEVPDGVPEEVGAAVYAIAQEALTNVLRHSQAQHVELTLTVDAQTLRLTVRDDGTGGAVHREGMGLPGMHDRARAVGGTLSAGPRSSGPRPGGPRPGGPQATGRQSASGFEVSADLPLEGS
ncbi:histidine kinase [Ornithinimicrobium faecis]|uniref:histidine kinase n=1 Tax=Ornithinimicrobium faecis TaxID=2934158 RepID=A0ABY4YSH7_9MICO|nr:histidine kinase [Ornithinimicrobium sp. HY1793]USQ79679.1 histidine kinase [Ornithinimicrobium sp. HY1793]